MNDCYVCFEASESRQLCACINRFVHNECLKKLIETRNFDLHCPVCLELLPNVDVVCGARTCKRPSILTHIFVIVACMTTVGTSATIWLGAIYEELGEQKWVFSAFLMFHSSMLTWSVGLLCLRRRTFWRDFSCFENARCVVFKNTDPMSA